LFKLDSVFFFFVPLVVFCFAIVVGSLLSLSSLLPVVRAFEEGKKSLLAEEEAEGISLPVIVFSLSACF
jgi:hypothetical protein